MKRANKIWSLLKANENKILTFADQALVSGGNFFASILYARFLGLEIFGAFVLAWMVVLFASSIQQAFIFAPMINIYPTQNSEEKKKDYNKTLFSIQLLFALVCMMATGIFLLINKSTFKIQYLYRLEIGLPIAMFAYLMQDFFRRKLMLINKIKFTFLLDLVMNLLLFGSIFSFQIFQMLSLQNLFYILTLSYFISILLGIFFTKSFTTTFDIKFYLQMHINQGKWLSATAILQWMSGNYFIIVGGNILGTKETGIIRIAQNLIGILNILFIAIESYIPISASRIYNKYGTHSLFKYLENVTGKGMIITLCICFPTAFFANEIISLIYGNQYAQYGYVLTFFALFSILVFMAIPIRYAIRTLEENHHIFIGYAISAAFSLCFANFLVKNYYLNGVLVGIVITQILTQFWFIFSLRKYIYEHYSFGTRKS